MRSLAKRVFAPVLPALALALALALVACGGGSDPSPNFQTTFTSVPLSIAPRVAASQDGSTWVAWVEKAGNGESLVAEHLNGSGAAQRTTVAPTVQAVRAQYLLMLNATPLMAWWELGAGGERQARVAAYVNGQWKIELTVGPLVVDDIQLIATAGGSASLAWQELTTSGQTQVVSSQRLAGGAWSAPLIIRSVSSDASQSPPRQAAAQDGALVTMWTESGPGNSGAQVQQTLWASHYDSAAKTWGAPAIVDAGQLHAPFDIASTGTGAWLAVWLSGDASQRTVIRFKRWFQGTWDANADRIDAGEDDQLNELALASQGNRIFVAWTGVAADLSSGSVRVANFDAAGGLWSLPARVGASTTGFPVLPRAQSNGARSSVLVWNISQGPGGPFLASADEHGAWQAGTQLDLQSVGTAADVAVFPAGNIVATWYRVVSTSLSDIVVRGMPWAP